MCIPKLPESIETYEFIGFNTPTATMLYKKFMDCVAEYGYSTPNDIPAYMHSHLKQPKHGLNYLPTYPKAVMKVLAIREDIQAAILDPEFRNQFETHNLLA